MKVLTINGSPHLNGCTARALTELENTLKECGEVYNKFEDSFQAFFSYFC